MTTTAQPAAAERHCDDLATTPTTVRPDTSAAILAALRALLAEAQAEHDSAEELGVRHILRCELSGIKRAISRAETVAIRSGVEL